MYMENGVFDEGEKLSLLETLSLLGFIFWQADNYIHF